MSNGEGDTTIRIPARLMAELKRHAAARDMTVDALFQQGLKLFFIALESEDRPDEGVFVRVADQPEWKVRWGTNAADDDNPLA